MKIFIGSSIEATRREIVAKLAYWVEEAGHEPVRWDKPGLFPLGHFILSRLIEISREGDAAILVFSEDDQVWYRDDLVRKPRDNVLVEYGLFARALGIKNVVVAREGDARNPSDLVGIKYLDVSLSRENRARIELAEWMKSLRKLPETEEVRITGADSFAERFNQEPATAGAAPLIVDHFVSDQHLCVDSSVNGIPPDPAITGNSSGSSIACLGNARFLSITLNKEPTNTPGASAIDITGTEMGFSLKDGCNVSIGEIVYSGNANGTGNALNLDLTPYNEFIVNLLTSDLFPWQLTLEVTSADGLPTASSTHNIISPLVAQQVFPFAAFANGSVFKETVGKIRVTWHNGPDSLDFSIDDIDVNRR